MIPNEMTSMPILFVGERLHPVGQILLFAIAFIVALEFLPAGIERDKLPQLEESQPLS
jgi:hypothetical protein